MVVGIAALVLVSAPRTIEWSGQTWQVKGGPQKMGPGPNLWADDSQSVWVDAQGRLHLTIKPRDGVWRSTEVVLSKTLGYGTYQFEVATPARAIPKNVILGLFTWSNNPEQANREIDIELARWNDDRAANAQFVVQPYDRPGNMVRFETPANEPLIHRFTWTPGRIDFLTARRNGGHIAEWTASGPHIPESKDEGVNINLWQMEGQVPAGGRPVEVVLTRFQFTPAPAKPGR